MSLRCWLKVTRSPVLPANAPDAGRAMRDRAASRPRMSDRQQCREPEHDGRHDAGAYARAAGLAALLGGFASDAPASLGFIPYDGV
ncbi:hypothetical protein G6F57_019456 [Rhizopus arrhizus]|nr:hypothetical protein G6F57_019456 [Rhizopus arrhizus]